jgi:hypothetical protein
MYQHRHAAGVATLGVADADADAPEPVASRG